MSDLSTIVTNNQILKLSQAGIVSLYDLITYFPYKYETLYDFDTTNIQNGRSYLITGTIVAIDTIRTYHKVTIQSLACSKQITGLYFVKARFVRSVYRVGVCVQAEIYISNNYQTIRSMAEFKNQQTGALKLGKLPQCDIILPYYSKNGKVNTVLLRTIHSRLNDAYYNLDLTGLIPSESTIPSSISLTQVHKPTSVQEPSESLRHFYRLQVFLKLAAHKYATTDKETYFGRLSSTSRDYLTSLSELLDYELTNSQKLAIWNVVTSFESRDISSTTHERRYD